MGTPLPGKVAGAYSDALGAPWCLILDRTPDATPDEDVDVLPAWFPPTTSLFACSFAFRC